MSKLLLSSRPLQVEVTANYPKQELLVRQVGANPSVAAGTSLRKSNTILLGPMASIELLEGKYKYHIHFGKRVPQEALEKNQSSDNRDVDSGREKKSPDDSDLLSSTSRKRRHSQDIEEEATSSKKLKVSKPAKPPLGTRTSTRLASKTVSEELSTSKATSEKSNKSSIVNEESSIDKHKQSSLDAFFSGGSTSVGGPGVEMDCSWKEVDTMLILQYGDAVHSSKLACFDLDGTLIETASGKRLVHVGLLAELC